jgi:hypothetical protein
MTTTFVNFGDERDYVLSVSTRMSLGDEQVQAYFLMIPDEASLQVILRQAKLA